MNSSLSAFAPENLLSRDGFDSPVPRHPVHLHTQAESGAHLRDSSQVPRGRPFIYPTGGVLLYLPHHLDLASEDSVGHSTCMSVLARRRAIMGSIVQPKRSCLGLSMCCHVLVTVHAGASQGYVLGIPLYPTGRSST